MADEIIIETTSQEVIEVGVPGPQGPAGAAGTGLETLTTQGDTLYRGSSTGERLPIGTTGQVLKVSAQGIPAWANESGAVTSVNGATGAVVIPTYTYGSGGSGLVPQATGGQAYEFLRGDGVWSQPTTDQISGLAQNYITVSRVETDYFDRGSDNAASRPGTGGQKRYQVVLSNDTRLTNPREVAWITPAPTSPTNNTTNPAVGSVAYDGNYLYVLVIAPGGQSKRWGRVPMPLNW